MKNTSFTLLFLLVFSLLNAQNNCLDFDRTDDYVNCRSQPTLSNAVSCNNLVIGSSSALTVSSNTLTSTGYVLNEGTLTVSGTLINNGTSSTFINNGTLTDNGTVILRNLINNSGKTVNINENKEMTINGDLDNSGTMTVKSSTTGTGSLIVSGTSTGNVIFKRYVDETAKGAKWHYVSSPVAGQAIDGDYMTNNSIYSPNGGTNYNFYRWDEPTNYWIIYGSTGSPATFGDGTFVEARGYSITRNGAGELSFTGTVRTSDVTYAATYNSGQGDGFNLVGNPFTSSIGVTSSASSTENFLAENTALLDDSYEALYIWDEQSGYSGNRNDYKVISNSGISGYTSINQHYISPGQAFMVKVVSPGGDLAFNENMQAHNNATFYKEDKEVWPSVELIVENNELFNSTAIGFNENMTKGLDPSYDVAKLKGNPDIALYTRLVEDNGVDFAIQALPSFNIENYIVTVGLDVSTTQNLEISANTVDMENYNIFLEDRNLNVFTDLKKNIYTATVSESGTGRFYLHFKDVSGIEDEMFNLNSIRVYASGKTLYVINPERKTGTIRIFNLTGQEVASPPLTGDTQQQQSLNVDNVILIVQIQTSKEIISDKVFIK